jgi:hypothetical protein
MKRFTIQCEFGYVKAPFEVYIGLPAKGKHPLHYQRLWLARERSGKIPAEILESFSRLLEIAQTNDVSFEDLCIYALNEAEKERTEAAASEAETPGAAPDPDGA